MKKIFGIRLELITYNGDNFLLPSQGCVSLSNTTSIMRVARSRSIIEWWNHFLSTMVMQVRDKIIIMYLRCWTAIIIHLVSLACWTLQWPSLKSRKRNARLVILYTIPPPNGSMSSTQKLEGNVMTNRSNWLHSDRSKGEAGFCPILSMSWATPLSYNSWDVWQFCVASLAR